MRKIFSTLVLALTATAAIAGGPIYIQDPAARLPYRWPAGITPVLVDQGVLGQLDKARADAMVSYALAQWNGVPTSSFEAAVGGDLPYDVTADNILDWLGAWNGGGIHVVYDADGSITEFLFGYSGAVLGVTIVEYVDEDSADILEATVVLNGAAVPGDWVSADEAAAMYAGVVTHEIGHAINLAHSQLNGQLFAFFEPYVGPEGCSDPYTSFPDASQVETMYPFVNIYQNGVQQGSVDVLDDVAALSDIYPAAGWPGSFGTIQGKVLTPGHGPHTSEVTAVNVIARNVADPFGDAISGISGQYSQGQLGPDGAYVFHGLTPGASYVIYLDGLIAGAFAVQPATTVMPGPEEYFNGGAESGDGIADDRCASTPVTAAAGGAATANLTFNRVKDAPIFRPIDLPLSGVADISRDGSTAVGTWEGGMFRWTKASGFELIGGSPYSPSPGISEDGQTIVGEVTDTTTFGYPIDVAAVWQGGQSWAPIDLVPGNEPCDASLISAWDASNGGKVVGLSWRDCVETSAYQWTPATGTQELGFLADSDFGSSRANTLSADGSIVIGWDRNWFGYWRGVRWDNGVESLIELDTPQICDSDPASPFYEQSYVGTAYGINNDGSAIVGEGYPVQREFDFGDGTVIRYCEGGAWIWTASEGVRSLGEFPDPSYTTAYANDVSDDAAVVVGGAYGFGPFGPPPAPMIWTEATGQLNFQEFLAAQGTWAPGWTVTGAGAVSGDAETIAGNAATPYGLQGYVVDIPKVVICHYTKGNGRQPSKKNSVAVDFPEALENHLDHGDTIGICGNGQ
jgi:probable HAF family extracellular repeat protein